MNMSKENIICDTDNYIKKFDQDMCLQYNAYYVKLICHYLEYLSDHTLLQNDNYFIFILQRGILSLSHIFNILLLYTKNIDLTISHCNKALYYYIEFIGQIADDSHSYLQLNSKDAALFIYKKTIFELNNDYRKNYILKESDREFLNILTHLNNICNELVMIILAKKDFTLKKKEIMISYTLKNIEKKMNLFKIFTFKELEKKIPILLFFMNVIQHCKVDIDKFLAIFEIFIKKVKKKKITMDEIKNKVYHPLNQLYISNFTPTKYINWIFS